jgi:hypothetical protein
MPENVVPSSEPASAPVTLQRRQVGTGKNDGVAEITGIDVERPRRACEAQCRATTIVDPHHPVAGHPVVGQTDRPARATLVRNFAVTCRREIVQRLDVAVRDRLAGQAQQLLDHADPQTLGPVGRLVEQPVPDLQLVRAEVGGKADPRRQRERRREIQNQTVVQSRAAEAHAGHQVETALLNDLRPRKAAVVDDLDAVDRHVDGPGHQIRRQQIARLKLLEQHLAAGLRIAPPRPCQTAAGWSPGGKTVQKLGP